MSKERLVQDMCGRCLTFLDGSNGSWRESFLGLHNPPDESAVPRFIIYMYIYTVLEMAMHAAAYDFVCAV